MAMNKMTAADPETRSEDIVAENIEQLKTLFPEAFSEGKIDFDVLRQLLNGAVEEREEKYGLNWFGKRKARQLALTPSTGTLRPCSEDSVNWDTTQNIIIEGDNLEVLKLLQKSYAGEVKLIYIDPPYNTGKDFIYPDDYQDNIKNYLELTGQIEGGRKISSNTESSGRFHTDWLNMMYPRLKLARTLLREDGVIFISIDDVELQNLSLLLNEVFGEENHVASLVWKKAYGGGSKAKYVVGLHEYILCYAKNKQLIEGIDLPPDPEVRKYYKYQDDKYAKRGPHRLQPLWTNSMDPRPNLRYAIPWKGNEIWPEKQWQWEKARVYKALENDELVFIAGKERWSVYYKQYLLDEDGQERGAKPYSILEGPYTQEGTLEIQALFGDGKIFPFPKPTNLIKQLLSYSWKDKNAIVLDFFAGSAVTAQAVLDMNKEDKGKRRFILVQLPEPTNNQEYPTIAEITKERVRRVIKKLDEEEAGQLSIGDKQDRGFRVCKLDTSNVQAWEVDRLNLPMTLENSVQHLKTDRSEADILYELLLKLGLDLCVPIETRTIAEKTIRSVGKGVLLVCLAEQITWEDAEPLALGIVDWYKELAPAGETICVFRDSGFADDVAKSNLAAILEQYGLSNMRSL